MIRFLPTLAARCLVIAVLGPCVVLGAGAAAASDAGFRDMNFSDDERGRTIPVALWYPTDDTAAALTYGGIHAGRAATGGAIAPGRHPLALLSHGTGGNRFNQFNLAEFLARHGYIVAALEHPGDRTFDNGDFGSAKNLYNRPRDLSFVLGALLADSAIGDQIDDKRIAALGHSAGGFTAIAAAGGRPKLQNLFDYCVRQPTASLTCPKNAGEPGEEDPLYIDFMSGSVSLKDPRLRALVVAAPAIGPLFDASGLAEVDIPVLIFWAGADAILNEPDNSRFYLDGIARAQEREMPGIGHFTFLSECSNMLRSVAPQICTDPQGVLRADQHRAINSETLDFLSRHLGN
ncbi:MAG: prolyl oligopeptidase family serine peptidase [Proteobacteria bacterium]|nr:prolyl oligopeptidase family serine peptidase [Pseudomonadota bacterium]MDA1355856.1 prolyl oligopeptidase family serine peptidase [Pseudomonadota bacterium]